MKDQERYNGSLGLDRRRDFCSCMKVLFQSQKKSEGAKKSPPKELKIFV